MSTTPVGADPVGASHGSRPGSQRAALLAGAIAVAILAVVLVAHAVRGSTKVAPSTNATAGSSSSGAATAGMPGMATTPVAPVATKGIPTVSAAMLPAMPMSASAPTPMAMVPLGEAVWDGMSIQARTSAPAMFELFNGTGQQLVRPTKKDSFHLMVLLADEHTGFAIPYSSVWATFRKGRKIVFDERLWPMISRYMGPHYGNNVSLPAAGLYHLTLLVSPPAAARHLEYKNLWLKPHRVQLSFRWVPKSEGGMK